MFQKRKEEEGELVGKEGEELEGKKHWLSHLSQSGPETSASELSWVAAVNTDSRDPHHTSDS